MRAFIAGMLTVVLAYTVGLDRTVAFLERADAEVKAAAAIAFGERPLPELEAH